MTIDKESEKESTNTGVNEYKRKINCKEQFSQIKGDLEQYSKTLKSILYPTGSKSEEIKQEHGMIMLLPKKTVPRENFDK